MAFSLLVWCSSASALTVEPVGTFDQPVSVVSSPGDAGRLLVVERPGTVVEVSASGSRVLADLTALVSCCLNERGLSSIVPALDFDSSGRFYAAYAGTPAAGGEEGDFHVDSFRPDPSPGDALIREPIISIDHDQHSDHYGGQLQFGPDGDLYISVGDGAGGGDPLGSGQNTGTLLGKILRIEPRPGEVPAYAIPAGNPFSGVPGEDEIWAYGLRNPWRFSFDGLTGDMVIGDVGQQLREEIDYAPSPVAGSVGGAGANYGWSCREGFSVFPGAPGGCGPATSFVEPVFDYSHTAPDGTHRCAVIGGYVVRDPSLGDLYGRYLYSDLCDGDIRSLVLPSGAGAATGDRSEGLAVENPVAFGEDAAGRLYVALSSGPVYRLAASTPVVKPQAVSGGAGSSGAPLSVRLRLRLGAASGRGVRLVARVIPCAGHSGQKVQLNRGGQRLAVKRLDRDCTARFFARAARPSTFRAQLLGSPPIRSRRLRVEPPGVMR